MYTFYWTLKQLLRHWIEVTGSRKRQQVKSFGKGAKNCRNRESVWVPSHCGLFGNEVADEAAKAGSSMEQTGGVTLNTAKRVIQRWAAQRVEEGKRDDWHKRTFGNSCMPAVKEPVVRTTMHQLRTGHCRLLGAYAHRIGIRSDDRCRVKNCRDECCPLATCERCGEEPDTSEHFLLRCPAFTSRRRDWDIKGAKDLSRGRYVEEMARWLTGRLGRPPDY